MVRHFFVVLVAAMFVSGCAAFDSSEDANINPNSALMSSGAQAGVYAGTYKGDLSEENNTCKVAAKDKDEAGSIEMVVRHKDADVNVSVDGAAAMNGNLTGEKVILMTQDTVKKVHKAYYLTFADEGKIEGTLEVIEINDAGMYAEPCATYKLTLSKEGAVAAKKK